MNITIDQLTFNVVVDTKKLNENHFPILFLHGFTGCADDWKFIFEKIHPHFIPIAIDLIGHGKTYSPADRKLYSTQEITSHIKSILDNLSLSKIILCGYSMGGRAALAFSLMFPSYVYGLILESTTPGIELRTERNLRLAQDRKLADLILKKGIEWFVDYWLNQPLFKTYEKLGEQNLDRIRKLKLNNNITGLTNMLLEFGTGNMSSYWTKLNKLYCKTLLITGSLDNKFTSINKKMQYLIPHSQHKIADGCGHNVHLENPSEFIFLLNSFIKNFI